MADVFPTALEAHRTPTGSGSADTPSTSLATMLDRFARALESAQAKIGVDGSAVTTSLDYKLANQAVDVKAGGTTKGTRKGIDFTDSASLAWTITDDGANNDVNVSGTVIAGGAASDLATSGASVNVSAASPPSTGQVLTATDATHATWQAPSGGAPSTAQYLVGALDAGLSAERVVTDTATVSWDLAGAGLAKANVVDGSIADAKLRNSGALSVIGRGANSAGAPADISATATSGAVLRESGSTIGFGTVATVGIADNAITLGKLADIATDRLLGRDTAASGDPEELTVGGGIEFTGAGGIQRSALTGDVTATAGSGSTTIANDAVTYAKIQNVSAASKVLGRGSAGGSGDVEEITLGTNLSMSGTTLNATGGSGNTLYAPGSTTVATGNFQVHVKRLELTTTQRLTLAGTARFRLMN